MALFLSSWLAPLVASVACDCAPQPTAVLFKQSDWVFVGRVSDIALMEPDGAGKEPKIRVTWEKEKQWKGTASLTVLDTTMNKYSCHGFLGNKGDRFLVFARKTKGLYTTDLCEHILSTYPDFEQRMAELQKLTGGPTSLQKVEQPGATVLYGTLQRNKVGAVVSYRLHLTETLGQQLASQGALVPTDVDSLDKDFVTLQDVSSALLPLATNIGKRVKMSGRVTACTGDDCVAGKGNALFLAQSLELLETKPAGRKR